LQRNQQKRKLLRKRKNSLLKQPFPKGCFYDNIKYMQIRVKETNIKLNTGLSSFLEKKIKKIEKLLPDVPDLIVDIEVGLTSKHHQKGDIYKAETQVQLGQKLLRSVSEKDNIRSAIIESVEDLEGQLRKRKEAYLARRKVK